MRMTSSIYNEEPVLPVNSVRREGRFSAELYPQAATFLLYFCFVVAYQWLSQAYSLTFGGYADEPAHYMTSLMIRDYLLSGFRLSPLAFAERYYVHYPAIAFGMWGPLLPILGGVWMVLFSGSRVSSLLFMGVIAAGFAWSTQWIVTRSFGRIVGVLAGLAVCLIPAFRVYSGIVMADMLTGIFMLWSAYFWYRYLETGRMNMSLRFGILATLALLTKANAGVLVLVPVPATLLAGRTDLFRQRSFWVSVPIVALFAGPWYVLWNWFMANLTRLPWTAATATAYLVQSLGIFWLWTIPFVVAGLGSGFFRKTPTLAPRGLWAVAVSSTLAFIFYHCVVPVGVYEARYVLMVTPWIMILLILGAEWFGKMAPSSLGRLAATIVLSAVVVYGAVTIRFPAKTDLPYAAVVTDLLAQPNLPQSVFMISSEGAVETIFVAEVASQDRRPNHFVLRASKMMAHMNWNGDRYENKIGDEAQIRAKLIAWGVSHVVIDTTPGRTPWPHHRLLRSAISTDPSWRLTRRYGPVEVYAFQDVVKMPKTIEVEVPYTLRLTLTAPTGE